MHGKLLVECTEKCSLNAHGKLLIDRMQRHAKLLVECTKEGQAEIFETIFEALKKKKMNTSDAVAMRDKLQKDRAAVVTPQKGSR